MIINEISAILDEPILLGTIPGKRGRWPWSARSEDFPLILTGATASTMLQISRVIESIEVHTEDDRGDLAVWNMITSNVDRMVDIIALAIHNGKGKPPLFLTDALLQTPVPILKSYMEIVYGRLGIEHFFGCMGLIRSLNVHKSDTQETTPPGA